MIKILRILAWAFTLTLLSLSPSLAQSVPNSVTNPINPGCVPATGVNCTVWTPSQWIGAWQSKQDYPIPAGPAPGVFNVRLQFGAKPDGTTDNSAAIAAAFTAANAYTAGAPTVVFDCDTSATKCEYNYGGSGISPINPLVPMAVQCTPNAELNYTGTAHAADIGPTTLSKAEAARYELSGCTLTGGASYTAGIYVNSFIVDLYIHNNRFLNFGSVSYPTILFPPSSNVWNPVVTDNLWSNTDGVAKSMLDAHFSVDSGLIFTGNVSECYGSDGSACPVAGQGYGLWIFTGIIENNQIPFMSPDIRISGCATCGGGLGLQISNNIITNNPNATVPCITFGDPGGIGDGVGNFLQITNNDFFCPQNSGVSVIGPETAGTGSYDLQAAKILNNWFQAPPASAPYVNTNGGVSNTFEGNIDQSLHLIDQHTSPPIVDTGFATQKSFFDYKVFQGSSGSLVGSIPVLTVNSGQNNALNFTQGSFHNLVTSKLCADTSGSGTTQVCNTAPNFDSSGNAITPVAGDQIVYTTTTTITGAMTINVNGMGATAVMKAQGQTALGTGDIHAGAYNTLTFDGTVWETAF